MEDIMVLNVYEILLNPQNCQVKNTCFHTDTDTHTHTHKVFDGAGGPSQTGSLPIFSLLCYVCVSYRLGEQLHTELRSASPAW